MSKHSILMKKVICHYHPDFVSSKDLRKYGLKHPTIFNIERLVEECLAHIGPYLFVDEYGYDFSDFSDSKTSTVNVNTRKIEISNVETKVGSLRITTYNPLKEDLDYFFVPKTHLSRVRQPCYGNASHKERIVFTYTENNDFYNSFEKYRIANFEELALAN